MEDKLLRTSALSRLLGLDSRGLAGTFADHYRAILWCADCLEGSLDSTWLSFLVKNSATVRL